MTAIPPPPAAPPKGKKKLLGGVLIGCGCLLFILAVILLGSWFVAKRASSALEKYKSGMSEPEHQSGEETASSQDVKTYVNSPDGRTGNLAESYVDFHFDYPSSWTLSSQGSDSSNFVTVARPQTEGSTTENLSVGYFQGSGSREGDAQLFPQLMAQLYSQFSGQFPGLEKDSEGTTTIGQYSAYQGLFHSKVEGKDLQVYLRVALIPNPDEGQKNGVTMLMFATSAAEGFSGSDDVGVKGELPVILNSFRFGK